MFFTPDLLCKTGGKFAVVWLAAMKRNRLKRKDFDSVDLPLVCEELEKLLAPSWTGKMATVQGFSLRLSAQLVYGISVVYNMKVTFLYKDVNREYQNLHRHHYTFDLNPINLAQSPKTTKNIYDERIVDNFHTIDPLFGQNLIHDAISPTLLAPHSFHDLPLPEPLINENDLQRNVVQDLSTITLKEQTEQFTLQDEHNKMPEEMDRPPQTIEELELLLPPQQDQFTDFLNMEQGVGHQNLATPKASTSQAKTPERPKKKRRPSMVEEEDENKKDDEKEKDVEKELLDENKLPEEIPLPEVPLPEVPMPEIPLQQESPKSKDELVLDPVSSSQAKAAKKSTTKKKQKKKGAKINAGSKLLVDEEIFISTEDMKRNMEEGVASYGEKQFLTPIHLPSVKELFDVPTHWHPIHAPGKNLHFHKGLNEDDENEIPYLDIYRGNCEYIEEGDDVIVDQQQPAVVPDIEETIIAAAAGIPTEKPEETVADKTEEMTRAEEVIPETTAEERLLLEEELNLLNEDREKSDVNTIEESRMTNNESVMIQRSANKSSILQQHTSRISNVSRKGSTLGQGSFNEPFSKSGLEMPPDLNLSSRLLDDEQQLEHLLQQEAADFQTNLTTNSNIEDKIKLEVLEGNYDMTFSSLVPPGDTNRIEAARSFFDLLLMKKFRKVELQQSEDFGEISITPTISYIG